MPGTHKLLSHNHVDQSTVDPNVPRLSLPATRSQRADCGCRIGSSLFPRGLCKSAGPRDFLLFSCPPVGVALVNVPACDCGDEAKGAEAAYHHRRCKAEQSSSSAAHPWTCFAALFPAIALMTLPNMGILLVCVMQETGREWFRARCYPGNSGTGCVSHIHRLWTKRPQGAFSVSMRL